MDGWIPFDASTVKRWGTSTFPPGVITNTLTYSPQTPAEKVGGRRSRLSRRAARAASPGQGGREIHDRHSRADARAQDPRGHAHGIHPEGDRRPGSLDLQAGDAGDLPVTSPFEASLDFATFGTKSPDVLADNGVTLVDDPAGSLAALESRPSQLFVVDPVYPYDQLIAGKEGDAEAEFVIAADGAVEAIAIRKATEPAFGRALTAALEAWYFEPARKAGESTWQSRRSCAGISARTLRAGTGRGAARRPGARRGDGRLDAEGSRCAAEAALSGRARISGGTSRAGARGNGGDRVRPRRRRQVPARADRQGQRRTLWLGGGDRRGAVGVRPAETRGVPVDVRFTIPFEFKPQQ